MYDELEKPLRELALREPLAERARLMTDSPPANAPNGIKTVRVSVDNAQNEAKLEVHFFNLNYLAAIVAAYAANRSLARQFFPISGGSRLRAGSASGQVQVDSSPAPAPASIAMPDAAKPVLILTVKPIGDYSTYSLEVRSSIPDAIFDPLFAEISFKFRPGCFNTNCAPEWETSPPPLPEPEIDYLAKDYGSFRQTMIAAMMERVPQWEPTSEADLDMVLADLFSVAADELSDYQDRVMNEAYLAAARKRVSLARHARLMDYHIHQGNQASSWLALEIDHPSAPQSFQLTEGLKVWVNESEEASVGGKKELPAVFISRHEDAVSVHQYLNSIGLYTWSDTITTLKAGSIRADLKLYQTLYPGDASTPVDITTRAAAEEIRDLLRAQEVKYLLIQEHLNPKTGLQIGRNPSKRQLLRLLPGDDGAEALHDPVKNEWLVRVRWEKTDALRQDYCFTVDCPVDNPGTAIGAVNNVSLFHGNLVEVFHGSQKTTLFKDEGVPLDFTNPDKPLQFHYERNPYGEPARWGVICRLPEKFLAYKNTEPGGDTPPVSTLQVDVLVNNVPSTWDEVPSLIYSNDSAESGDHFVVETDENRRSLIRFGNGKNGMELPDGAEVSCTYQYGEPLEGNVGADMISNFDAAKLIADFGINLRACWNPFDVTNGREPEPAAEIIRRVPESYRQNQLRAVTLQDYVARAEQVEGVARAAARYAWTGSWRTVRLTINPAGTGELSYKLRKKVEAYLNAVRLIGEDLEIRPPIFVPLEINVILCAMPDVWPDDIKFILEQEFSDGWTPDGRKGFFHPDLWTFGQPLYASQIIGHAMKVKGVEHVVAQKKGPGSAGTSISVRIKRRNGPFEPVESLTQVAYNEIIQVQNDPDHVERGGITFEVKGGRQ
jgi:hypothetical protein